MGGSIKDVHTDIQQSPALQFSRGSLTLRFSKNELGGGLLNSSIRKRETANAVTEVRTGLRRDVKIACQ